MARKLNTNLWRRDLKKEVATVGLIDATWAPVVVEGDIDVEASPALTPNSCAQVVGLVAPAEWNGFEVSNGNVVVVNTNGDIVSVLGSTVMV